jgi:hypothetical protein
VISVAENTNKSQKKPRFCRSFHNWIGKLVKKKNEVWGTEGKREPRNCCALLGKADVKVFWNFKHIKRNFPKKFNKENLN